jgi:propanol-preferring alcohol dehydrogenase
MWAMRLERPGTPLVRVELPDPAPGAGQVRVRITACGVCRTDLHVVDGDLTPLRSPVIPGHEIIGVVDVLGKGVSSHSVGNRVGIGWLGSACGSCLYCTGDRENLCDAPVFTGYTVDGGFATHTCVDARYAYPIGEGGEDAELAPLLCAGLIGWRSLKTAGDASVLGLYGFGAAAHIILQVAKWQGRRCHVFTRPEDVDSQKFARMLGADWVGGSDEPPPELLDAAMIFAPVGSLVPVALRAVKKGGRVVCAGIHMSDIPTFPYSILWGERSIASVANLTRADAEEFLSLVPGVGVQTHTRVYPLERANDALDDLRAGRLQGAAVLRPDP